MLPLLTKRLVFMPLFTFFVSCALVYVPPCVLCPTCSVPAFCPHLFPHFPLISFPTYTHCLVFFVAHSLSTFVYLLVCTRFVVCDTRYLLCVFALSFPSVVLFCVFVFF